MSVDKNLPYEEVCEKVAAFLKKEPLLLIGYSNKLALLKFDKTVEVANEIANKMLERGLIKPEDSSMRMFTDAVRHVVNHLATYTDKLLDTY